jgi:hypothetical protein
MAARRRLPIAIQNAKEWEPLCFGRANSISGFTIAHWAAVECELKIVIPAAGIYGLS